MSDLIKRSDAIGAITNHCENECYFRVDNWCPQCQREEFEEAIKAVPSAESQGWIPCSERLPEPYVEVLVCDDFGWINLGAYRPCDVSEDCSGWSIHAHTKIGTEEVIAWMPLPKPWKGADDDTQES